MISRHQWKQRALDRLIETHQLRISSRSVIFIYFQYFDLKDLRRHASPSIHTKRSMRRSTPCDVFDVLSNYHQNLHDRSRPQRIWKTYTTIKYSSEEIFLAVMISCQDRSRVTCTSEHVYQWWYRIAHSSSLHISTQKSVHISSFLHENS